MRSPMARVESRNPVDRVVASRLSLVVFVEWLYFGFVDLSFSSETGRKCAQPHTRTKTRSLKRQQGQHRLNCKPCHFTSRMPLGKGASRHTVGGSRRGTITHLLALSLGISLGSFISNLGGPLGLSGYFGSPREAGEGSGTGGTPNPARSGAERGGHFDARQDAPGTYAEWISRVMPPSLAPVYVAPGALPFNLTMSILRRTRPVVGSTDRVRGFLTKLKKGQCTTSLMLGGSVTAAASSFAFHSFKKLDDIEHITTTATNQPKLFVDYLNARFPCTGADGGSGEHVYKTTNAGNSMSHATSFSSVSNLDRIDLILVEFNVNDHFMPGKDVPHALEDKGPWSDTLGAMLASAVYSLTPTISKPLSRKRVPVALVQRDAASEASPASEAGLSRHRRFQRRLHREDMGGKSVVRPQNSPTGPLPVQPGAAQALAVVPLRHPRRRSPCSCPGPGVQLRRRAVEDGKRRERRPRGQDGGRLHHRPAQTADEGPGVHEPRGQSLEDNHILVHTNSTYRITHQEERLYVRGSSDGVAIDLTDPDGEDKWRGEIVASEGWTWFADNKDKDKYGLIADSVDGGQHVAFRVTGQKHGVVEVTFVVSYENFGIALVWLDDKEENTRSGDCLTPLKEVLWQPRQLSGVWDERASVPQAQLLEERLEMGDSKVLHICLTPFDGSHRQGEGNKFKLMGIRMY
ncbi:hypothetical protein THAOC_02590 [Thalassiosira oceanica]|uniref:Uncharacterized protein n=1 Tax=Thalassiosira oceanica TaxID=159749 RepID=K0TLX4_THAOC|nr:hypothetical protein THAOC_02590 [Thalassiosira oceanica]|eukprot:EJK75681.1 hypothetical protein THAOC_02590 [Thalassiosira oceanica]